ncbi:MAG: FAD-binding oxidoreductase [Alphaproteobacteria bacterium]|nr:FAD-binding oxidoreductase [Alphaproteobacteria bacterium]
MSKKAQAQYAIIGGGIVGLSVAYGLAKLGHDVHVIDEGDQTFRASRGNFGLVWVQSKGLAQPDYARWSIKSRHAWLDFATQLEAETGIDVRLQQIGGYDFHFSEESLNQRIEEYEELKKALGGDYPYRVLLREELLKEEPNIGDQVYGAILHEWDGHVNPLKLLHALATACRKIGVSFILNSTVEEVKKSDNKYKIYNASGCVLAAEKVILCAGLGARELGPKLGFKAPVKPQAGQVLISEKTAPLFNRPSATVRQVDEGGIQIGASSEDVGLDDRENIPVTAGLARDAIALYPVLQNIKLVRSWTALRIMSPDGLPIYQKSLTHPGISLVTCHSGITLAAAHSKYLPQWLTGVGEDVDDLARLLASFSEARFNV